MSGVSSITITSVAYNGSVLTGSFTYFGVNSEGFTITVANATGTTVASEKGSFSRSIFISVAASLQPASVTVSYGSPQTAQASAGVVANAPSINSIVYDGSTVTVQAGALLYPAIGYQVFLNAPNGSSLTTTTSPAVLSATIPAGETWTVTACGVTGTGGTGPLCAPVNVVSASPSLSSASFDGTNLTVAFAAPPAGATGLVTVAQAGGANAQTFPNQTSPATVTTGALTASGAWRVSVQYQSGVATGPASGSYRIFNVAPVLTSAVWEDGDPGALSLAWTTALNPAAPVYVLQISYSGGSMTVPFVGSAQNTASLPAQALPGAYTMQIASGGPLDYGPWSNAIPVVVDGGWAMPQANAQRTGVSLSELPAGLVTSFPAVTLATALGGSLACDVNGNFYAADATTTGNVYCVSESGSLSWTFATNQALTSGGVLLGPGGTVYVAGANLVALTPGATSASQLFSYALGTGAVCAGPMALDAAGTTLYVLTTAGGASSVSAITLPTTSGGQPTTAWTTALASGGSNQLSSSSGIAVDGSGTIWTGDNAGNLYSISSSGTLTVRNVAGSALTLPAAGPDGTIHVLALGSGTTSAPKLIAYVPSQSSAPQTFTPTSANPAPAPNAGPSITGDNTVYIGFDTIYCLSFTAAGGYTLLWNGDPGSFHGTQPGAIAVDATGAAVSCGTDNWMVAFTAIGAFLWNEQLTTGGGPPIVPTGGGVAWIDGTTLNCGEAGGGSATIAQIVALMSNNTRTVNSQTVYTINSFTVPQADVYFLFLNALGEDITLSVAGSLTSTTTSLTLTGTGVFQTLTNASLTLVLSEAAGAPGEGTTFTLQSTIAFGSGFTLSQAFPALAGSFFDTLTFSTATFTQTSSNGALADGWSFSGTCAMSGSLATLASLLGLASTATGTVSGTVALNGFEVPEIALTLTGASAFSLSLSSSWSLPITVALTAEWDTDYLALVVNIVASTSISINGTTATFSAIVPPNGGGVALEANFTPTLTLTSLADMLFWSGASSTNFSTALNTIASQTSFGLEQVRINLAPFASAANVLQSITLAFSAGSYTVFSAATGGVSLQLSNVFVTVTVLGPLQTTPSYSVSIDGDITIGTATIHAGAIRQWSTSSDSGWVITGYSHGQFALGASTIISTLGGTGSLPANVTANSFSNIAFAATPALNAYSFEFTSGSTWNLFTIGSLSVQLTDLSLAITCTSTTPDGTASAVGVMVGGQVVLGGVPFMVSAFIPSTGGWSFATHLQRAQNLPTLSALVTAIAGSTVAGNLPSQIANIGSGFVIDELDLSVSAGSTTSSNSLALAIESAPGWTGWTVFTSPFTFKISYVLVGVFLTDDTRSTLPALDVDAVFQFGTSGGGVLLSVPVPLSAGTVTFSLVEPWQLPSISDVVNLLNSSWASQLPSSVATLGTGITLSAFTVTANTTTSTYTLAMALASSDPASAWSPLGLTGFALSNLGASGNVQSVSGTVTASLSLSGTLLIGTNGSIPLVASMTGNFSTFTLQLPGGATATLPSVGDLISLFSSTWSAALPSAITSIGSGLTLTAFTMQKAAAASTVNATVTLPVTAVSFPGFSAITLNSFTLTLAYASTSSPAFSGSLVLAATLLGQAVSLTASMPNATFAATMTLTDFDLETLVEDFLGDDTSVPSWLSNIGIAQISVSGTFGTPSTLSVSAVLTTVIDVPAAGTITDITISASFAATTTVCVSGTWTPPIGPSYSGELCYPFTSFIPAANPASPFTSFPNGGATTLSGPTEALMTEIAGQFTAYCAGGATAATLAQAFYASEYQEGANPTACAAGAFAYLNNATDAATLAKIVAALEEASQPPDNTPAAIALALYNGASYQGITLTDGQVALALAQGLTSTTAALTAQGILAVHPTDTPAQLVAALNTATYTPEDIAPVLPFFYDATNTTPMTRASLVLPILTANCSSTTTSDYANALADAGFGAAECVPALMTSYTTTTASAMAALLAPNFTPAQAALPLYQQFNATQLYSASTFATLITGAWSSVTAAQFVAACAAVPFPAAQVVSALNSSFSSTAGTGATAATALASVTAAAYNAPAIAAPLLAVYASTTWGTATDLANAIIGANAGVQPGAVMQALEAAGFGPFDAYTAWNSVASTQWPTLANANGLATALGGGNYGAAVALAVLDEYYNSSVSTVTLACTVLYQTSIYTSDEATDALLAMAFTPASVSSAVSSIYG